MTQEDFQELLPAYALGALSTAEATQVEAYLSAHPEQKTELYKWQETVAACAWAALLVPKHLAKTGLESGPVGHPARVVMLSIDGLRQDTAFQVGLQDFKGFQVHNGFTAIPATRVMWSILWGGDPGHYSVGNLFPAMEEFEGTYPFTLLETAKTQGLKSRFYIDDGGTIALADRTQAFVG